MCKNITLGSWLVSAAFFLAKEKKKKEETIDQVLSLSAATWGAKLILTYYCLLFPVWEMSTGAADHMIEVQK